MSFQKMNPWLIIVFFVLAGISTFFAMDPDWKERIQAQIWGDQRDVLGMLQGQLNPNGQQYTVIKVREGRTLYLEVHHTPSLEGPQGLIARVPLQDRFDARVELAGRYTNLALVNLNPDPAPEILAPTLDSNLVPRLNLFQFNETTKQIVRVSLPEGN